MNVALLFKQLTETRPVPLDQLSNDFGIYALRDHEGQIRYIGSTPKATEGFRTRIYNKHRSGSEGRSHKFTQAYCTGRMWRFCKKLHVPDAGALEIPADAAMAKKLRNAFILEHCSATYISIPESEIDGPYFSGLTSIEYALQAMAPISMRLWEGIKFREMPEPTELVDKLLRSHQQLADSAERQGQIYNRYISQ